MDAEATKKCPFCAERIKEEAIKCRFCGEMLDASRPRHISSSEEVAYETKAFVIPFPDGSPPTQHLFKYGDDPFPSAFYRDMRWPKPFLEQPLTWSQGTEKLWYRYKDHFLERINEVGQEGWDLVEPFGRVIDFECQKVEAQGAFGKVKRFRVTGAKFIMRRANIRARQDAI